MRAYFAVMINVGEHAGVSEMMLNVASYSFVIPNEESVVLNLQATIVHLDYVPEVAGPRVRRDDEHQMNWPG